MNIQYEIFSSENDGETKTDNINTLFGYPDLSTGTTTYRDIFKHIDEDEWAGGVGDDLVLACSEMTPEERADYYDNSDLKTMSYLNDNGWFPEPPEEA